jgi:hypothetical protein
MIEHQPLADGASPKRMIRHHPCISASHPKIPSNIHWMVDIQNRTVQAILLLGSSLESALALSAVLSLCIALAELLAGGGLITGLWLVSASILGLLLLTLFSGAMLINLVRGRRDLSCHCAGVIGEHRIS